MSDAPARNRAFGPLWLLIALIALVAAFATALLTAGQARAALQPADITFTSVDPIAQPGFGVYNFSIDYAGPEVAPFIKGATQGHCVQFTESAGTGPGTLASGADIALSGPGDSILGDTDEARILWLLLSSRASQTQPSAGLTLAQEGAAHQSAVWSITDAGDPGTVPDDPAAAARAAALVSGSVSGAAVAGQAASFTAVGTASCSDVTRNVVVSGAPFTTASLSIVSGSGTFASNGGTSIAVALGADGTATVGVNGRPGTVAIEAIVARAELVQVQKVDGSPTGQDFGYAVTPPTTLRLELAFRDCTTTTAGDTPRRANLRITKAGPRRARAGSVMTYTIRIRNRSRTAARNLVVRDRLPRGMVLTRRPAGARLRGRTIEWRVRSLAPRRTIVRRVRVRVLNSVRGRRCNRATVTSTNARRRQAQRCTRVIALPKRPNLPSVTG